MSCFFHVSLLFRQNSKKKEIPFLRHRNSISHRYKKPLLQIRLFFYYKMSGGKGHIIVTFVLEPTFIKSCNEMNFYVASVRPQGRDLESRQTLALASLWHGTSE